jgi:hypothetical protein
MPTTQRAGSSKNKLGDIHYYNLQTGISTPRKIPAGKRGQVSADEPKIDGNDILFVSPKTKGGILSQEQQSLIKLHSGQARTGGFGKLAKIVYDKLTDKVVNETDIKKIVKLLETVKDFSKTANTPDYDARVRTVFPELVSWNDDAPTPEESKEMERRQREEDVVEEEREGVPQLKPQRPQRPSRTEEKPTIAELERQPLPPPRPQPRPQPRPRPPMSPPSSHGSLLGEFNKISLDRPLPPSMPSPDEKFTTGVMQTQIYPVQFVPEQGTAFPIESATRKPPAPMRMPPPKPFRATPYIDSVKPSSTRLVTKAGEQKEEANPIPTGTPSIIDSTINDDMANLDSKAKEEYKGVSASSIYGFNPNSKSMLTQLEQAEKNRMLNKYMNEATLMSSQPSSVFKGGATDIYDKDDYKVMEDDSRYAMGGAEQTDSYVPNLFNAMKPSDMGGVGVRQIPRNPLSDLRPRQERPPPPPYSGSGLPPYSGRGLPSYSESRGHRNAPEVGSNEWYMAGSPDTSNYTIDAYGVVPPRGSAPIDPMIGGVALPQQKPRQVIDDWKNQQEDRDVPRNNIDNALRDFNLNQGRMDGRRLSELSDIYSGSIINRDNLLGGGSISSQIARNLANSAGKGDRQGEGLYGEEGNIFNNTDVPNPRTLDQRFAQLGMMGGNGGGGMGGNGGGGMGGGGGFNLGGRGMGGAGKFVNLKNRNMTYSNLMGIGGIPMSGIKETREANIPYQQPNQTIKGNAVNLIRRSNQRSILNNNEYMP